MSLNLVDYNGLVKFKEELEQSISSQQSGGTVSDERLIDNASVNILENKLESGSGTSLSYTSNKDGTVTIINSTASSAEYVVVNSEVELYAGNYTLYGCAMGGSSNTYWLEVTPVGGTTYKDYGHGVNFTVNSDTTAQVRIGVATTCSNILFKPSLERGTKDLLVYTEPSSENAFDDNIVIIDEYEVDGDIYIVTYNKATGEYYAPTVKPQATGIDGLPAINDYNEYYPTNVELAGMMKDISDIDVATSSRVGVVKPDGITITIDQDGTLHGSATVDIATSSAVGTVKPDGTTITIDQDGTIHGASTVSVATSSTVGTVKPDNSTTEVDNSGTLSAKKATSSTLGVVQPDNSTLSVNGNGVLSVSVTNYTDSELDQMWADALEAADENNTAIEP